MQIPEDHDSDGAELPIPTAPPYPTNLDPHIPASIAENEQLRKLYIELLAKFQSQPPPHSHEGPTSFSPNSFLSAPDLRSSHTQFLSLFPRYSPEWIDQTIGRTARTRGRKVLSRGYSTIHQHAAGPIPSPTRIGEQLFLWRTEWWHPRERNKMCETAVAISSLTGYCASQLCTCIRRGRQTEGPCTHVCALFVLLLAYQKGKMSLVIETEARPVFREAPKSYDDSWSQRTDKIHLLSETLREGITWEELHREILERENRRKREEREKAALKRKREEEEEEEEERQAMVEKKRKTLQQPEAGRRGGGGECIRCGQIGTTTQILPHIVNHECVVEAIGEPKEDQGEKKVVLQLQNKQTKQWMMLAIKESATMERVVEQIGGMWFGCEGKYEVVGGRKEEVVGGMEEGKTVQVQFETDAQILITVHQKLKEQAVRAVVPVVEVLARGGETEKEEKDE